MAENSFIEVNDDSIAIGFPFEKIDVKNRTVEGFATLDNVDKTGEIVDYDASKMAFNDWVGNIREMHGTKAVGKALYFEDRPLEKDGNKYNGIWVKAYISKGADDTWQKILDGTLQGFSIGGRVLEKRPEVVKNDGPYSERRVVRITKYMLGELSVVDNPANPLALFMNGENTTKASLVKFADGTAEPTDLVADEMKVYYCGTCDIAKSEPAISDGIECPTCDSNMALIGTAYEVPDRELIKSMVTKSMEKDTSTETVEKGGVFDSVLGTDSGTPEVDLVNPDISPETPEIEEVTLKSEESDLQLNDNNDTKILTLLNQLLEMVSTKTETVSEAVKTTTPSQGGEIAELEKENLNSILDILKSAFASVEELLNKWSVTALNSENATDVEVAKPASLPGSHDTPQLQIPGSNGADMGLPAPSADNVTPHSPMLGKSEEPSGETAVAEETTLQKTEGEETVVESESEDLAKTLSTKLDEAFEKVADKFTSIEERLVAIESTGAVKKSGEVNETEDLKKSVNTFWSGAFSPSSYNG